MGGTGTAGRRRDLASPPRNGRQASVGLLVERRYLTQREPAAMAAALLSRGARVDVALADVPGAVRSLAACDVVVARGRSAALLDALESLAAQGVPLLNPPRAIAAVVDKALMAETLARAGVAAPATFAVRAAAIASAAARAGFPAVVKPVFGDNGRGIVVVRSPDEAGRLAWSEPRAIVQPLLPSSGRDLKLYGVGGEIWAVEKPSPLGGVGGSAIPVPLPPGARALGLRCGALFGLELYGVDCLATADGLAVVEVNDFPNYSAVPDADARIADLVLARARGERHVARPA